MNNIVMPQKKLNAVSYYRKHKYGTKYSEADLESIYQKSYDKYDDIDIIEYIIDEFGDDSGYTRLLEMCNNGKIDIILIPSIARVFSPISKASTFFNEVLSFSKQITVFCAFEGMEFTDKEKTRKYFEILKEFADKESEKKTRAMSDSFHHMPPISRRIRR